MKIGIVTSIYNEEYLLPIFLEHYKFADEITFFYDTDTTDNSLEIINEYKKTNVVIQEFNTGVGIDDEYMTIQLHEKLKSTIMDYSICVDADELLFHKNKNFLTLGDDIKNYISEDFCDYYIASFYQMYPNISESNDIVHNKPIWEQRKYGFFHDMYLKPCIIKKDCGLYYSNGKHFIYQEGRPRPINEFGGLGDQDFEGCHLNNINLESSIIRRIEHRKNRMSKSNLERGSGSEYFNLTEDDIRREYGSPEIIKLW